MRIAVVTPYYKEPSDWLSTCLESVRAQDVDCTHILVADGHARDDLPEADPRLVHMRLPRAHADYGDTPRTLGALSAVTLGFDAIAFLDADNWYYPGHLSTMARLAAEHGVCVVTASRELYTREGVLMYEDDFSDGKRHADTSCYFLTRPAFRILPYWMLKPLWMGPIDDQIFYTAIRGHNLPRHHHPEPTVGYRTPYQTHYEKAGLPLPPDVKNAHGIRAVFDRWREAPEGFKHAFGAWLGSGRWHPGDPVSHVLGRREAAPSGAGAPPREG
ncbi:MAG: glycosyltransferase [Alphaproteobacteria bacterium]|nr:glycosyltransferase [Alphaproteobacteria bacterium]